MKTISPTTIASVFEKDYTKLVSLAQKVLKSKEDSENVVMDSFEKALKIVSRREIPADNPEGWIARIVRNAAIDLFRKNSRSPVSTGEPVGLFHETVPGPDQEIILAETKSEVRRAVSKLKPRQREVVIARYWEDIPYSEIAKLTGQNINTCLGRNRYALKHLRAEIS